MAVSLGLKAETVLADFASIETGGSHVVLDMKSDVLSLEVEARRAEWIGIVFGVVQLRLAIPLESSPHFKPFSKVRVLIVQIPKDLFELKN
jgi:hypothetical protein